MSKVLAIILGLLLTVGIIVGGYQLGWWLKANEVNRTAKILNNNYNRQTGLQQDVIDKARDIADIDVQLTQVADQYKAPLIAQRKAILDQFCNSYLQLGNSAIVPQNVQILGQEC